MAKKKPDRDFSAFSLATPPPIQIATIIYTDGREVRLADVGDRAMTEEARAYVKLRDLAPEQLLPGICAPEARDLAQEITEAEREHDEAEQKKRSKRNSRPGDRKKNVTKAELLAFRDRREYDKGTAWGWQEAACVKYKISRKTLDRRLKSPD